jgi:hypothetical protein
MRQSRGPSDLRGGDNSFEFGRSHLNESSQGIVLDLKSPPAAQIQVCMRHFTVAQECKWKNSMRDINKLEGLVARMVLVGWK